MVFHVYLKLFIDTLDRETENMKLTKYEYAGGTSALRKRASPARMSSTAVRRPRLHLRCFPVFALLLSRLWTGGLFNYPWFPVSPPILSPILVHHPLPPPNSLATSCLPPPLHLSP